MTNTGSLLSSLPTDQELLVPSYAAITIALALPRDRENPRGLEELCRIINQPKGANSFSDFGKKDNYPHIPLGMGVLPIPEIAAFIRDIVLYTNQGIDEKKYAPLQLTVESIYQKNPGQTNQEYQLLISRTPKLVELHAHFMGILRTRMKEYGSRMDLDSEFFFVDDDERYQFGTKENDEIWEPSTVDEVDQYKSMKPEDYRPHLSLKCRNVHEEAVRPQLELPHSFIADRVIVAYTGNHCSARQIAYEMKLGKK